MSDLPVPRPTGRAPACSCTPGITAPAAGGGRFSPTHALILLICFLALGSALFLAGTPMDTVFALLGGLGRSAQPP